MVNHQHFSPDFRVYRSKFLGVCIGRSLFAKVKDIFNMHLFLNVSQILGSAVMPCLLTSSMD